MKIHIKNVLSRLKDFKLVFNSSEGNGMADRVAKKSLSFTNYLPKLFIIVSNWVRSRVEIDVPEFYQTFGFMKNSC